MSSFNINKLFLILSLLILNFIGMIHCSYQPDNFNFKYPALEQPDDQILIEKRNQFEFTNVYNEKDTVRLNEIFPQNKIFYVYPHNSRSGTCYNDAMRRTLALSGEQFNELTSSMISCEDWIKILRMPYKYFDQIKCPQLNCLATYSQNNNNFDILHMATATHNNKFISKGGSTNVIIQHDPWSLPMMYGDRMCSWKLKEKYSGNEQNKNLLFIKLRHKIKTSLDMKNKLQAYNQTLLTSLDHCLIDRILIAIMGINLNVRNGLGETPAIVAAKNKKYDIALLYLDYGANVNLQDNNGKTLLMIAINQEHQQFMQLLFEYKANPYIKDNNGQTALIHAAQLKNKTILTALMEYHRCLAKLCLDKM